MAISNIFLKKKFVCLTFFENADARDLSLMTLFFTLLSISLLVPIMPSITTVHIGKYVCKRWLPLARYMATTVVCE